MRIGKLPEPVLKRSVLRQVGQPSAEKLLYGTDCGITEKGVCCTSVGSLPGFERLPHKQVIGVVNNLAAAGARPDSLLVHALLPADWEESTLRQEMSSIANAAQIYGMKIIGGHTEVSEQVLTPQYILTGMGTCDACAADTWTREKHLSGMQMLCPGQDLVLTKWIAIGGTAALVRRFEPQLRKRYPFSLVDAAAALESEMAVVKEAEIARRIGETAMHDLSQGGVFGALWEMADRAGVGLEIDLKKIPIRQETVEICEFADVNPYELYSAGALLIGTDHAEELIFALKEAGIPAAMIGHVTDGRDRVIRNGDECRHLDRPPQDAWYHYLSHVRG